jgi:hypothetical protein
MRRNGPRQICVPVLLVAALVQSVLAGLGNDEKPLRVKLTAIGQKNCRGRPNSSDSSVVRLKLQLEITNVSDRNLIVAKDIGAAWYGYIVAKDEQALAAGIYEDNPNIDWAGNESNLQSPPVNAPPAGFTILGPGKSLEVESIVYITVRRDALAGNHVLRLDLGTWFYVSPPEQFRESWKKYGELVYEPVKSEPMPFRVPPEADFARCRF